MVVGRTAALLSTPHVAVTVAVAGVVALGATAYVATRPAPAVVPPPTVATAGLPGAAPSAFRIAGSLASMPVPGVTVPVHVTLTNPHAFPIVVNGLSVRLDRITGHGPRRCGPADFTVRQFSGRYGFTLPAFRTSTLGQLGLRPTAWPQIAMLNRPVNQDGCKGVRIMLVITGTAVRTSR